MQGLDDRGFVWYTNYDSRKGGELEGNALACLTFWWGDLEVCRVCDTRDGWIDRCLVLFFVFRTITHAQIQSPNVPCPSLSDAHHHTTTTTIQRSVRVEGTVERVSEAQRYVARLLVFD